MFEEKKNRALDCYMIADGHDWKRHISDCVRNYPVQPKDSVDFLPDISFLWFTHSLITT